MTVSWFLLLCFGIAAVTIEQFVHLCRPDFVSKKARPPLSTTKKPSTRKRGVKHFVHAYLTSGKKGTLEQLVNLSGGSTEGAIRTALTDLKNPTYALNGKAINIEKDEEGRYFVPAVAHKKSK